MKKRETIILELLSEQGRIDVVTLAEKLGVSQVTVRKDLDVLESKGIVRREHGYAVFGGSDDMNNRLAINYEQKRMIAKCAAELVAPGETIMIESGSCCALLALSRMGWRIWRGSCGAGGIPFFLCPRV